jgi:hypothetical protein
MMALGAHSTRIELRPLFDFLTVFGGNTMPTLSLGCLPSSKLDNAGRV